MSAPPPRFSFYNSFDYRYFHMILRGARSLSLSAIATVASPHAPLCASASLHTPSPAGRRAPGGRGARARGPRPRAPAPRGASTSTRASLSPPFQTDFTLLIIVLYILMLSRALSAVIVVEMIFASILVTCRHHNVANVGTQGLVTIVLDGQELDAVFLEVQTLQHEDLCALDVDPPGVGTTRRPGTGLRGSKKSKKTKMTNEGDGAGLSPY